VECAATVQALGRGDADRTEADRVRRAEAQLHRRAGAAPASGGVELF